MNGFEVGGSRAVVVGLSVPHDHPVAGVSGISERMRPNVYLLSTDVAAGTTDLRWLTKFNPKRGRWVATKPSLMRLSDDRLAVLWSLVQNGQSQAEYRLIDNTGAVLASKTWRGAWFNPHGQPLARDGHIWWVQTTPKLTHNDTPQKSSREYLFSMDIADQTNPILADTPSRLR